jgi:hypothetical protein
MRFLWSDAWILQAIAVAARDGVATLADVIAAADAVNHALPTHDELHGALCRLTQGAFVKETPVGFGLGPSVSPEIALTIAAENPADGREAASDLLGAERWTAERNVRDPRNKVIYAGLTDERLRAAEREYRRRGPM